MNSLLNHRNDDEMGDTPDRQDREITLGTTMLLGIFFALAVLCAVFFGFGYTVGTRRNVATTLLPATVPVASSPFNGFKPAPGNPAGSASGVRQPSVSAVTLPSSPAAGSNRMPPSQESPSVEAPDPARREPQTPEPPASSTSYARTASKVVQLAPAAAIVSAGTSGVGQAVVQIAAVSHQEDADLLISTLKRRGYNVAIRQEPQDKLLHLQIGPFATRKEADAMRQRLLSDGFNAIVK